MGLSEIEDFPTVVIAMWDSPAQFAGHELLSKKVGDLGAVDLRYAIK